MTSSKEGQEIRLEKRYLFGSEPNMFIHTLCLSSYAGSSIAHEKLQIRFVA